MPSQTDDLVHDDDVAVAADFLDYLRENSLDPPGVSRASFGPGERMAHARLAEVARGLGLVLQTNGFCWQSLCDTAGTGSILAGRDDRLASRCCAAWRQF